MSDEWTAPFPSTEEEFLEAYRKELYSWPKKYDEMTDEEREAGYNASAESLWKAAVIAFNYAASVAGVSAFQAGYGALKFYGEITGKTGPYGVIDGEHLLYPQYNVYAELDEYVQNWMPWVIEQAQINLETLNPALVNPDVWTFWEHLTTLIENYIAPEEAVIN